MLEDKKERGIYPSHFIILYLEMFQYFNVYAFETNERFIAYTVNNIE